LIKRLQEFSEAGLKETVRPTGYSIVC